MKKVRLIKHLSIIKKFFVLVLLTASMNLWADVGSHNSSPKPPSLPQSQEHRLQLSAKPAETPLLERIENSTVKQQLNRLTHAHSTIGGYVQNIGEGLDSFFGDDDLEVLSKKNRLKILLPIDFYAAGRVEQDIDFKLQIDLPRTQNRWKIFIESIDENEEDGATLNQSQSNAGTAPDEDTKLGGRYMLANQKNRLASIDSGIEFNGLNGLNPFIEYQERYRRQISSEISSRTTHTLLLEKDEGLAWRAEQVFDKALANKTLIRSQSSMRWWRQDREVLINQRFVLFNQPNPLRAVAYYTSANWLANNETLDFTSVNLGVNWRERIFKDWMFAQIEPQVTWVQNNPSLSSPQYRLRFVLEAHFYK